jgi:hypothetical protein
MPFPMLCERGGGHIKLSQMSGLNVKSMHTGYEVNLSVTILHFNLSSLQIIVTGHLPECAHLVCYRNLILVTFAWITCMEILHTT